MKISLLVITPVNDPKLILNVISWLAKRLFA